MSDQLLVTYSEGFGDCMFNCIQLVQRDRWIKSFKSFKQLDIQKIVKLYGHYYTIGQICNDIQITAEKDKIYAITKLFPNGSFGNFSLIDFIENIINEHDDLENNDSQGYDSDQEFEVENYIDPSFYVNIPTNLISSVIILPTGPSNPMIPQLP